MNFAGAGSYRPSPSPATNYRNLGPDAKRLLVTQFGVPGVSQDTSRRQQQQQQQQQQAPGGGIGRGIGFDLALVSDAAVEASCFQSSRSALLVLCELYVGTAEALRNIAKANKKEEQQQAATGAASAAAVGDADVGSGSWSAKPPPSSSFLSKQQQQPRARRGQASQRGRGRGGSGGALSMAALLARDAQQASITSGGLVGDGDDDSEDSYFDASSTAGGGGGGGRDEPPSAYSLTSLMDTSVALSAYSSSSSASTMSMPVVVDAAAVGHLPFPERMAALRQKAQFSAKTGDFNERMTKLRELVKSTSAASAG